MSQVPFLDVQRLTHRYGARTVLSDISFCLKQGEVFGLLGPNGAGKSTLLSLLVTLGRPSEGDILFEGVSILQQPGVIRGRTGYVPQELALHATLSAAGNLRFWAGVYGLKGMEAKKAATEVLTQMHLLSRASDRVDTWSGGMKRRLNLAAALMHHPDLLILDEPTSGVDAGSRQTIASMIRGFRDAEKTVLMTSHDTDALSAVCDRVGVLHQGQLLALGSIPEVLSATGYDTLEACLLGLEAGT